MHRKEELKETRPSTRSKIGGWPLNLTLFVAFQILFILFDDTSIWDILNLNKLGEEVIVFLQPFFDWFQPYESAELNYVTAIWGLVVVVHGIVWLVGLLRKRR